MKFREIYHLTVSFVVGMVSGAGIFLDTTVNNDVKKDEKKPVNTGKIIRPNIKVQYDTVSVTDEMIDNFPIMSAGIFKPYSGHVHISYFTTDSRRPLTQRFCNQTNDQIRLVRRHEMEHARKANLTKNTVHFSPTVRAAIAAQNEIMAPASEIIEALDYHYETGHPYPTNKSFILYADREITDLAMRENLSWPLDFNNPQIADIVMKYAAFRFFSEINRGLYKKTLSRALQTNTRVAPYITNNTCDELASFMFFPEIGMWAPLWQFKSLRGDVNIWHAASFAQKQQLLNSVDSIINTVAGKNRYFFINMKIR